MVAVGVLLQVVVRALVLVPLRVVVRALVRVLLRVVVAELLQVVGGVLPPVVGGGGFFGRGRAGPQTIRLAEGYGTGQVIATFTEPGEYLMRARVDNFNRADSSDGDQCCWTNGYVKVNVTP